MSSEKRAGILNDEDKAIIKKFLLGGLALGGGTAAITSLLNYFNAKSKEQETNADDDVIYVYRDKNPEKSASALGLGIGAAAGTGTAMLAYSLVKKLYLDMRKKEAQEKLDKAQHIFIDAQGYKELKKEEEKKRDRQLEKHRGEDEEEGDDGQEKSAADEGRAPSFLEGVLSAPVAIPLLLTLAAGITTNEILKQNFSPPKPKIKPPKKIEFVDKPDADQLEYAKSAGYGEEDEMDDAAEFMIRLTLENPVDESDLVNLVKTAAMGGGEGLKDTVMTTSFPVALKMVKGASARTTDPLADHLAVCWLNKSARLKNCVRLVAAGEFVEKYPELYKQACHMPDWEKVGLLKLAALMGAAVRAERSSELGIRMEKKADVVNVGGGSGQEEDLLSELIAKINKERQDQMADQGQYGEEEMDDRDKVTEGDEYESSDTSGEEAGISDPDSPSRVGGKLSFIRAGKTTRTYAKERDKDIIDELLSPE